MSYDVGDTVVIESRTYIDEVLANPATIVAEAIAPDGTISTPAVTEEATGVHIAGVPATQAGTWRYTFTSTGPSEVQHGTFVVAAEPGSGRLEPIATIADVENILGRNLIESERLRAPGLLHSASTKVRAFCRGQQFVRVDDDQMILPAQGTTITLPQRPVIDVTAVAAIAREGGDDIPLTGWSWDGLTSINLRQAASTTTDYGTWWTGIGDHVNRYRVTNSHGYDVIPDDPVDVTAQAVARVLSSKGSEGTTQRTMGQYSEQFQQGAGAPGNSPWLSKAEKEQLIDAGFRRRSGSINLRRR